MGGNYGLERKPLPTIPADQLNLMYAVIGQYVATVAGFDKVVATLMEKMALATGLPAPKWRSDGSRSGGSGWKELCKALTDLDASEQQAIQGWFSLFDIVKKHRNTVAHSDFSNGAIDFGHGIRPDDIVYQPFRGEPFRFSEILRWQQEALDLMEHFENVCAIFMGTDAFARRRQW